MDNQQCYLRLLLHNNGKNTLFARGGFGELNVAFWKSSPGDSPTPPQLAAVKTFQRGTQEAVKQEISLLQRLNSHPNIVKLLSVSSDDGDDDTATAGGGGGVRRVVLEFCPTDVQQALEWRRKCRKPLLSTETIKILVYDLFSALDHCHSHNVVHRDIQPANLLISSRGVLQLCDFGLALPVGNSSSISRPRTGQGVCMLHYRSPEVLLGSVGDQPAADHFSAGTVVAELLLTYRPLFPGRTVLDQLDKIFACLGSPNNAASNNNNNWPGMQDYPDGKNSTFVPRHPPRALVEFLPRAAEIPPLLDLLQNSCFVLDPLQRSAPSLSNFYLCAPPPPPPCRAIVQHELIAPILDEPFLLGAHERIDEQQALQTASNRKGFLQQRPKQWRRFRPAEE